MKFPFSKISEIKSISFSGGTPLTSRPEYYNPPTIPWLKTKEVNYRPIYETESFISELGLKNSSAKIVPINSIIVAMYGQGETAGRVAINKIPLCTNQACFNLVVNPQIADYRFVYNALVLSYEALVMLKNGGAQPNLNAYKLNNFEIPCPELTIQTKIGDILSQYDELITVNRRRIAILEEMAMRTYQEWFVHFRFPGHETTEFVNGIPKGWTVGCLGDIARESGKSVKKQNRTKYKYYLPIDCMPRKSLTYTIVDSIENAESSLISFNKGDILFGAMRPYYHKVVFARDKGLTRSTCFVLNAKSKIMWGYLLMLLFDERTIDFATQVCTGSTMPYVLWDTMKKMNAIIPSDEVASLYLNFLEPIIEELDSLTHQNTQLQQMRDRLLPQLMSGQLEVTP